MAPARFSCRASQFLDVLATVLARPLIEPIEGKTK
jgi:hypothetical protein